MNVEKFIHGCGFVYFIDRLGQADQHMLQRKRKLEEGKEEAIKRAKVTRMIVDIEPLQNKTSLQANIQNNL